MKLINMSTFVLTAVMVASCQSQKQKLTDQITATENVLRNDSSGRAKVQKAEDIINLYKQYATTFPEDTASAQYLYRAADVSAHINRIPDAIKLYNEVSTKFPNSFRSPYALFMQAYLYENNLHDLKNAEQKYREFLSRYPNHELANDAAMSLQNLGKPLDDIVKQWENKSSQNDTVGS